MFCEINLSKRNVIISLMLLIGQLVAGDDRYESPCPETFNYFVQNDVLQYGVLKVVCPAETTVQLHVELSVGNNVQGYDGVIVLEASQEATILNILEHKPITYRLNFPQWFISPPKVTKVMVNGDPLCVGPPIDSNTMQIRTINLQHNLKLNVSPPGSGVPFTSLGLDPTVTVHFASTQSPTTNYWQPGLSSSIISNGTRTIAPIALRSTTEQPRPPTESVTFQHPPPQQTVQQSQPKEWSDRGDFHLNDDQCGHDVPPGTYPWLVAIFVFKTLADEFLCGANLISHKHVITAAQCMKDGSTTHEPELIFLRIGEHNYQQGPNEISSRLVGAERVLVHPDYKLMSADADIALIILDETIEYTKYVKPLCLWHWDASLDHTVGFTGTFVGWGKGQHTNPNAAERKMLTFPVVSQEACHQSHFPLRAITSNRTFCAGDKNGAGPFKGDNGIGFIMEREGRWYLRGILSLGGEKDSQRYSVFSNVTSFLDWIHSNN